MSGTHGCVRSTQEALSGPTTSARVERNGPRMQQAANDPALIRLGHLLPGAQPLTELKGASDTYRGLIEVA
jgi:hypothetical protein